MYFRTQKKKPTLSLGFRESFKYYKLGKDSFSGNIIKLFP